MQFDLFAPTSSATETEKASQAKPLAQKLTKPAFVPASLEKGMDPHSVQEHAMLWLRSLAKQSKNNPARFLAHQMSEVAFKQSIFDQVSVVRDALLRSLTQHK